MPGKNGSGKKKYQVHVGYSIYCSHVVDVEADNEQDAKAKAAQITYDTDMAAHIDDSTISEITIVGRPGDGKRSKNPSGVVGSPGSAGSKNKRGARG